MLMGCAVFVAGPAFGQEPPPTDIPHPLDEMAQETVFESPTRIEGRLLTFDTYDEAIWIEWTRVHNGVRWLYPPQGTQLLIYPRDMAMMDFFRALQPGAVLGMTIQKGQDGKRRVLELEGT
jgi:hypothetical protein